MAEIDVPDYYDLAASNYDNVVQLAHRLAGALKCGTEVKPTYRDLIDFNDEARIIHERLQMPEWQDALAVVAAIWGLNEGDQFSVAAMELQNRHRIINNVQLFFRAHMFLLSDSEVMRDVEQLHEKFRRYYYVSIESQ